MNGNPHFAHIAFANTIFTGTDLTVPLDDAFEARGVPNIFGNLQEFKSFSWHI